MQVTVQWPRIDAAGTASRVRGWTLKTDSIIWHRWRLQWRA